MAPIVSTAFDGRGRPRRLPITLSEHARRASCAPTGAIDVSRCERTAPSREDQDALRGGSVESVQYNFTLEGTMTRVPEVLLPDSMLISVLAECRLTLCESINLADIDATDIRRCMGLHGPPSRSAHELLQVYKAIRVTK